MKRLVVVSVGLAALMVGVVLAWYAVRQEREFQRLIAAGDAALAADQTYRAIEAFSGALALKGDSMLAHLKRGDTYRRRGELTAALRDLREAAILDPSAPRPVELLGDVNTVLSNIRTVTKEIEWADTLRLPPEAWRYIATVRMGAGDGLISILQYIENNNIYTAETKQPLDIGTLRDLATASQDGGGRMVAYRKDPEVLRFHLPMPKRGLDPRQKSLMGYETGLIARTGGVEIRLPYAMAYLDEITDVPA